MRVVLKKFVGWCLTAARLLTREGERKEHGLLLVHFLFICVHLFVFVWVVLFYVFHIIFH